MKKLLLFIIAVSGILFLTTSCKDQKSYADYLRDEERAIERFLLQNNLSVIERFPSDGVFESDEFYKDPETGVYYNIVEYGDTTENLFMGEEIYVRFSGLKYFMVDDSTTYNNKDTSNSPWPQTIIFRGPANSSTNSFYDTPGWVVPLTRIGHNGKVRLIVTFNMGSASDRQQYQPTYYDLVQYRFASRID